MRVFKTTYRDSKGKTRQAAKWYVEFRDHNETVRRLPAFTSKAASLEMGRNLEKLVGYHRATGGQVDPALVAWLAGLPQRTRDRVVTIGLLSSERVAVSKPISDHLDDFAGALTAKGSTERHVQLVLGRARRIIDSCGFRFYGDISGSKVAAFLNGLRTDTPKRRGISAQTFNFYLQAVKQFCRWMMKDRRATENPVAHLDRLNVKTDRRHDRRALAVGELVLLIDGAYTGPERSGMSGPQRGLLYRLAAETGLRAGELRSLTRMSFDLDGDSPTVAVEAAYSKRRRADTLPLRAELAGDLRDYLVAMTPSTPAFKMPRPDDLAKMLRADLDAVGIEYRDDAGRVVDFHALRHTFITNLASGGVHPKTAQALARHSTITLTMDRYSHSCRDQEIDALSRLPNLSETARQAARATGTDDAQPQGKNLASCLAQNERRGAIPVGAGGQTGPVNHVGNTCKKPRQSSEKRCSDAVNKRRRRDSNPRDAFAPNGFQDRRLQPLGHSSRSYCRHRPRGPTVTRVLMDASLYRPLRQQWPSPYPRQSGVVATP